ncbi:MAG: HAMP domain-containing histidine kinase [Coriobacteriia bacterium]|nr:HAMP domain-containing histidine kinase [Coriobacteriia bacterium]
MSSRKNDKGRGGRARFWGIASLNMAIVGFVFSALCLVAFALWQGGAISLQTLVVIAIISLISALLTVAVSLPIYWHLLSPLRQFRGILQEAIDGDLLVRINMTGEDLYSKLGSDIDELLETIQQARLNEVQLINDVAHELRSPLTAIQATLEGMIDGVLPTSESQLLAVNREVIRLSEALNAQLELARLERGSTQLRHSQIDISLLLSDLVMTHQIKAADSDLALEYISDPDVEVLGDINLLSRAFSNLLSNAIKYTAAGGKVTVQVRVDGPRAIITVADTGIGIAPENQELIFTRFWRVDSSHSRTSSGLGLGLSLVREIVQRHSGTIEVFSQLGEGSKFVISLPLLVYGNTYGM